MNRRNFGFWIMSTALMAHWPAVRGFWRPRIKGGWVLKDEDL